MPPRMTDWLPDDHLVWFVLDVVAELDTKALHARASKRRDGQSVRGAAGRAGYDPDMLLALLIYAYACGERSSRRIERLCHTDVAFRVICAEDVPDHPVLARFRQIHEGVFAELFVQVLRLCRAAGMVKLATVAIDGTKIAANASPGANRSAAWLVAEAAKMDQQAADRAEQGDRAGQGDWETVEGIFAQAQEVDAAEDALFGAGRGDELPVGWNGRAGRRERIRAAQARLAAAEELKRAQEQEAAAARAERDAAALAQAQAALATEVSTNPSDLVSYETMTAAAQHTAEVILADPEGIGALLYDAGYASEDTLEAAGDTTLIALGKTRSVREAARERPTTGPPPPRGHPPPGHGPSAAHSRRGCALHPPRCHRRARHRERQKTPHPLLPPRPGCRHQRGPPRRYRVQPPQTPPSQPRITPGPGPGRTATQSSMIETTSLIDTAQRDQSQRA